MFEQELVEAVWSHLHSIYLIQLKLEKKYKIKIISKQQNFLQLIFIEQIIVFPIDLARACDWISKKNLMEKIYVNIL